uniref:Uncharacterized protein n=1 Tax=Kalanchoe fedtschenkoi TaxID=63787 RepID=A0A7N0V9M8_KALFE
MYHLSSDDYNKPHILLLTYILVMLYQLQHCFIIIMQTFPHYFSKSCFPLRFKKKSNMIDSSNVSMIISYMTRLLTAAPSIHEACRN